MDNRLGAQYYTLRDTCTTLEDFAETCRKVSEIGYKTVQLSGIGDFEAKDIKPILDLYNLEVVCTHRPPMNYLENIEKEIEYHKILDCKIAGIGGGGAFFKWDSPETLAESVDAFIDKFNPVIDTLHKNGLVFGYHNHHFEFTRFGGIQPMEEILKKLDADKFKFILDVYWIAVTGMNPAKFIKEHKDRIACVHFKDIAMNPLKPSEVTMFEIGYGNLDWDEIIEACEEANVQYALVEQDTCQRDPFESIKMSYDFLKGKGFI